MRNPIKHIEYATYLLIILHFARLALKRGAVKKLNRWTPPKINADEYAVKLAISYRTTPNNNRFLIVQYFMTYSDASSAMFNVIRERYGNLYDSVRVLAPDDDLFVSGLCYSDTTVNQMVSMRHTLAEAYPDSPIEIIPVHQ